MYDPEDPPHRTRVRYGRVIRIPDFAMSDCAFPGHQSDKCTIRTQSTYCASAPWWLSHGQQSASRVGAARPGEDHTGMIMVWCAGYIRMRCAHATNPMPIGGAGLD